MTLYFLCLFLQDYYHNNCSAYDTAVDQLAYTRSLVRECRQVLLQGNEALLDIVLLEAVAKARYSLIVCAQWFYQLHIEQNLDRELTHCARRLCDAASYLCNQDQLKWLR